MNTEKIKLSRIKINEANPREIRQEKFQMLMRSILVFPKMLQMRPVVVDSKFKALGGNQRTAALNEIAKLSIEQIADRLIEIPDYANKESNEERVQILDWWSQWLDEPFAYAIKADKLTEDEKRQFIIKDNTSYGNWDYDMLADRWDNESLRNWGLEVWDDTPAPQPEQGSGEINEEDLPEELQGLDIDPDELPKLQGDDERPNDYVVITFEPEGKDNLLDFLGIDRTKWVDKVMYTLDEIISMKEE